MSYMKPQDRYICSSGLEFDQTVCTRQTNLDQRQVASRCTTNSSSGRRSPPPSSFAQCISRKKTHWNTLLKRWPVRTSNSGKGAWNSSSIIWRSRIADFSFDFSAFICLKGAYFESDNLLQIIDVFNLPCISYSEELRKIIVEPKKSVYLSKTDDLSIALRRRYRLVQQKIVRAEGPKYSKFFTVEALLGNVRKAPGVSVLATFHQFEGKKFFINIRNYGSGHEECKL
ncbi:hypothetical protein L596_004824 [Steinernema carpocapsae]|uniref:Uncharacterized protein n=1 Tax=Steinernema carpocapsae TaxID=34508 RepID=A0A4U8V167_STECR|nr:hypothetical protein L596_004824 [Steinernema carpocapsae]